MANGIGMELEEIGMVALIGIVLVPGVMWVAKARGVGRTLLRGAVVASLVFGAVALEASLDKRVEEAGQALGV